MLAGVLVLAGCRAWFDAVPYAGVLEFKDGKILKWREYFNAYVQTSQREKREVSPLVEAMLDRPVVKRAS